jgi:multiple sugar transport system substrate-binding protein
MVETRSLLLSRRALLANSAKVGTGALVVAASAGSRFGHVAAADRTTIDFPYLWTGPEGDALQKVVDRFNQSQETIEVKGVANPDAQRQLAAMASSNGFDISDNFGSNVGSWAAKGILEPLDEYVAADQFDTSDFVTATLDQMKYDGKLYALPVAVHTTLLLYNKDLFAAAGIAEPPKTTSQWADAIAKLTKADGSGNISQLGLNVAPDAPIGWTWAFGGQWADAQGNPTPTHPGNIACINFCLDNVFKKYGVDQVKKFQSGFGEYASPQNPFYVGKVAMVVDGEWQSRFVQLYAPNLNWGVAPIPVADDHPELAGATDLSSSMFFIPTNSRHKKEAWEFMKYLLSSDAMRDFTLALANLPARRSLLEDPAYAELPNFSAWLESLKSPNIHSFPSAEWSAEYLTELTSALDSIFNLKKSPEEGMADVEKKMQQIVK